MQKTLFFILPMIFASYILGALAEYEQNLYLYSVFSLLNGIIGGCVFFAHCSANKKTVAMMRKAKKSLCANG